MKVESRNKQNHGPLLLYNRIFGKDI